MKRFFLSTAFFLFCTTLLPAQGENNIWTFGFEANSAINFNTAPPSVIQLTTVPGNTSHWASAVCYPNGQLRFFLRFQYNFFGTTEYYLFGPTGVPIAGSDSILTDAGQLDFSMPVIIPRPGNPDQYYIFHSMNDGLFYSLLDMSLNAGAGSIVLTEKNMPLTPPGSIFTRLITSVKGCNGVWLVTRSQIFNEYYSFHVSSSGIDPQVVTSPVGNFTLPDYGWGGFLKASPDGSKLATTNWAGVECYEFEQCSGKVIDARVLDTTGNPPFYNGAAFFEPSNTGFTGICFSPDNSKLYVTKNQFLNYEVQPGKLYQFDFDQPTWAGIIASKTLVMTNQQSLGDNFATMQCDLPVNDPLGEIKEGPDGKLYINNGSCTCLDTGNIPPGYNPGPAFHTVTLPNVTGMGCLPAFNTLPVISGVCFNSSGYAVSYLQNEIVYSSTLLDTVMGETINKTACFADSLNLTTAFNAKCPLWDNAITNADRTVYSAGKYWVGYFKGCSYQTDTFHVRFIELPKLEVISQSCENSNTGKLSLSNTDGDTTTFRAIWRNQSGDVLQDRITNTRDEISGLSAGTYLVHVTTPLGCDTTLQAEIENYPGINVFAYPQDTTIRYGDSILLNATGAQFYVWWPSGSLDTATKSNPVAKPLRPTVFTVLGLGENGCADTGYVNVNIDYSMPDFLPNAFSPNGDGINDVFRIEGITYQKVMQFKIFNRYGNEIFSTHDGKRGWDGMQNGKRCDVGTYYYLIQLDYPDGRQKTFKGDLLLIR